MDNERVPIFLKGPISSRNDPRVPENDLWVLVTLRLPKVFTQKVFGNPGVCTPERIFGTPGHFRIGNYYFFE